MKKNTLTVVVGVLLVVIFLLLLFTFQVRQTEVAVVTTFDRQTRQIADPGLYFKLPMPIQKVYKFDKRIHNFEDSFDETITRDSYNLLSSVYVGWTIQNPNLFFNSFPSGETASAEPALKSLVRSAKNAVIGQHPFSHFVSNEPKAMKLMEIEGEILEKIRASAAEKYGIGVEFVGFKKIGLPESVTQKVFDRMMAERQREVDRLKAIGGAEKMNIQSAADRDRAEILAKARAEATAIRGQADAEATKAFKVFEQSPELAVFLIKLQALEKSLRERATLVVDERTPPFDVLRQLNKPATVESGH